ncbi:hypothetical protein HPP92_026931 [Vanilla planifolia]|uniref:Uncharacterized protein n=1 Tax=Vanilla planifolia TaxID=51239 RepID=A0A835PEB2_VANPL|nr:hypothetical protein HPP92_026931 [Vanilla planifolia]
MEAGSTPFKRMLVTYYRGNSLQKNKIDEAEKCHQSKKHPKRLHSQAVARTTGEEELRARRVMVSTLSFLLGFERVDDDDSEAPSEEDDECYACYIEKDVLFPLKGHYVEQEKENGKIATCYSRYEKGFAEKLFSRLHYLPNFCLYALHFGSRKTEVIPLIQKPDQKHLENFEDEMAAYGFEAEKDSLPVDNDICARVAYEEDEDL